MPDRFFYHSFPRRGANSELEIDKGCSILASMRDLGLGLIPEFIEWRQPLPGGQARLFPKVQQRACFTELEPAELPMHAERFGRFALEFDEITMREMGGVPVFYIPQPASESGGSQLGALLLSVTSDAQTLANRIRSVAEIIGGPERSQKVDVTTSFTLSPETAKTFRIDKNEAQVVFDMLGNALTPWDQLEHGLGFLLNMFYPADDIARGRPLDYYRQREWRIGASFAVGGKNVMRSVAKEEEAVFIAIDPDFFLRPVRRGFEEARVIDRTIVMPSLDGIPFLQLARRIIAPADAIDRVRELVTADAPDLEVVALEAL